jgi:hypothetical protein
MTEEQKRLEEEAASWRRLVKGSSSSWSETTSLTSALGGGFRSLMTVGSNLKDGIKDIAEQAIVLKNSWQEASKLGLGLGKDMFAFQAQLLEAGLTFDEYKKATQSLTVGVSGLGSGMNDSMKRFLTAVEQFKGSDLGDQARRFGATFEEMAELVAISTDRRLKQDRLVDGKNTELTQRASELAIAVAANTEVFGMSRTAQLEGLKKLQEDALVQQQLTAKQKQQYELVFASLDAMGLGKYGNLAVKTQGQFTSEQYAEMNLAMGVNNATDFRNAIKESLAAAESKDKGRIDAANERMLQVQERIIQYVNSEDAKNTASRSQFLDGSLRTGAETTATIKSLTAGVYERMQRDGIGIQEALAKAKETLAQNPADKNAKPTGGEITTDAVLKVERAVRDMGRDIGLAIRVGSEKTGELITGSLMKYYQQISNTNLQDRNAPRFSSANSGFSPKIIRDTLLEIRDVTSENVTDYITKKWTELFNAFKSLFEKREGGSPGVNSFLSNSGKLDGIFENWGTGTPAILHGSEAVVRPEQLTGIINKVQSSTQGLLGNVQNQFTPEKITNLINTAVTSAASQQPIAANNATTSQTQISNSTLDDIKAQLMTLNNIMDSHLRNILSTADKQYSALMSLSPDLHS